MRAALLFLLASLAALPASAEDDIPAVVASRRNLWSLQPIRQPSPPPSDSSWPRNAIDLFILERLAQENLTPSPQADQRTLVRRLHFSLTGLPPSPEAIKISPEETAAGLLPSRAAAEHLARQHHIPTSHDIPTNVQVLNVMQTRYKVQRCMVLRPCE